MVNMSTKKERKILDQVRDVMRLHHYAISTEKSYCEWIKRFILFHKMKARDDLNNGEKKIEMFLTDLAVNKKVAPSTQNQAMNALVFLYKKVLNQPLDKEINAIRASKKKNIPVVMTPEETVKIITLMEGTPQLVAKLMYGSGLRISEAIRLRIKDIDFTHVLQQGGQGVKSPLDDLILQIP